MRKHALLVAGSSIAALALAGGVATAHTTTYDGKVKINDVDLPKRGTTVFRGRVSSEKPSCVQGRDVTLYYKPAGGIPKPAGTDQANANGGWKISVETIPPGKYYARIEKITLGGPGHTHFCKGDGSNVYVRS